MFRTRQAPSPTGYLHFGTARTMLFTKLLTMAQNGTWYLRVEDTDRSRLQPDAVTNLLSAMKMLHLTADEGVTNQPHGDADDFYGVYQTGQYGPYIQSQRLAIYHEHAQNLLDKKLAYWSYLTDAEKTELMEIKKVTKKAINYYKANMEKYGENAMFVSVEEALSDQRKPALKYRLQRDASVECVDELLGKTTFDLNLEEDFNILKSDGYPTYHLGHLVDDYLMKTSLVIRAQEWFASMPKHVTMYQDYWGEVPQYLHLTFILGQTGNKKMSKRDGNVNMKDWLDNGYLPEAIINYLAFLGWNPGTEQELFVEAADFDIYNNPELQGKTMEEVRTWRLKKLMKNLSKQFSIKTLQKSPARFNLDKLNWFNREYIKLMTVEEFAWRMSENTATLKNFEQANLRIGDYAYVIDFDKQKMYCETIHTRGAGVENSLHPLGGGREKNETWSQNLIRELSEKSNGQLQLTENDFTPLIQPYPVINGTLYYPNDVTYDGKLFHLYLVQAKYEHLQSPIEEVEGKTTRYHDWCNLADVIEHNDIFTYPLWKNECIKNNWKLFVPTLGIMTQYAAAILDKNRITQLSERGMEANCVLHWTTPSTQIVKWKKISKEESIHNLKEIWEYITTQSDQMQLQQGEFFASLYTADAEQKLIEVSSEWEKRIKTWLKDNNKGIGDYLWPLRVTLSGVQRSPSPFELLAIISKDEAEKRVMSVISAS